MPTTERLVRVAAIVLTVAAVALALVVAQRTIAAVGEPWPGFAILAEGKVAPVTVLPPAAAEAAAALRYQDRVVAVGGTPVTSPADVRRLVRAVPPGTPITYTMERPGTGTVDVTIPTRRFTRQDVVDACLPFLLGGLLGLGLGLVPVLSRPDLALTRLFFVLNLGLAVDIAFRLVDAYAWQSYPRLGWLTTGLWTGGYLHLSLLYPARREPLRSWPRPTLVAAYGTSVLAALANVALGWHVAVLGVLVAANVLWLANVVLTFGRHGDPRLRQQGRVVVFGAAPVVLSCVVLGVSASGLVDLRLPPLVHLVPLWIFGGVLAYAVVEHNLFEVDAVVRRVVTLGLVGLGGLALYVALFVLFAAWLDAATAWAAAGVTAVLLLTVAPVVSPLRRRIEDVIERLLFPRQREARAAVHAASRELLALRDEADVARLARDAVERTMAGATARLVAGARGERLVELGPGGGAPLELSATHRLTVLANRGATVCFERLAAQRPRGAARADVEQAAAAGVSALVPLPAIGGATGALLVGPRGDGRWLTRDDEMLLETLAAQTAAALANARAWDAVRELERRLKAENVYLRQEVQQIHETGGIVGRSPALRAVLAQVEQVAPTDATVLVVGETGTGKELVVRALHVQSRRRERTLVKVACAALPETLLESELFGHERGAFTGAAARKPGRFEVADGGTLFLDDVDTLPLAVQAKLLRALQEGEVQRLGSNDVRRVDVRVVAATNRDLLAAVRAGAFREDLYYRLNVVPIQLPALRERREDIRLLVEHFVRADGPKLGREVREVAAETMAALEAHVWPGNVRELRNVVQRALVLANDDVLRLAGPLAAGADDERPDDVDAAPLAQQIRELKLRLIRSALDASGGNQRIAAERLGLHRQSLTRMIRELGLQRDAGVGARGPSPG